MRRADDPDPAAGAFDFSVAEVLRGRRTVVQKRGQDGFGPGSLKGYHGQVVGDVANLHLVRDEVTAQVSQHARDQRFVQVEKKGISGTQNPYVRQDLALNVQHRRRYAIAVAQSVDVVGHHPLKPLDAVRAGDGENGPVRKIEPAGAGTHRVVFRGGVAEMGRQAPFPSFEEDRAVALVESAE